VSLSSFHRFSGPSRTEEAGAKHRAAMRAKTARKDDPNTATTDQHYIRQRAREGAPHPDAHEMAMHRRNMERSASAHQSHLNREVDHGAIAGGAVHKGNPYHSKKSGKFTVKGGS